MIRWQPAAARISGWVVGQDSLAGREDRSIECRELVEFETLIGFAIEQGPRLFVPGDIRNRPRLQLGDILVQENFGDEAKLNSMDRVQQAEGGVVGLDRIRRISWLFHEASPSSKQRLSG